VEAAGIEPASENSPLEASTGLDQVFKLAIRWCPWSGYRRQVCLKKSYTRCDRRLWVPVG